MIVYDLACESAHRFEGWFSSADDFDAQCESGQIACPVCGSLSVSKQLSAPHVNVRSADPVPSSEDMETAVAGDVIEVLRRKFVEHVMANTEDVGARFPEEARRIHYKEAPNRSIRGRASREEIEELRDEGVEIVALPGIPAPPDPIH